MITFGQILWLSVAALPFIVFAALCWLKKGRWFNLSVLIVYILAYAIVSANGRYIWGNHGGHDNRAIWYAKWCGTQTVKFSGRRGSETTMFGVFFWPLAILDRIVIHKDIEDDM
jgi:hypothetical protein